MVRRFTSMHAGVTSLALLLAGTATWTPTTTEGATGNAMPAARGQRARAAPNPLGCYTRFQSSAWSSNIHGVYATNTGKRTLPAGTRIAWTVRMARNCTDEDASPSLSVGEFRLTAALAPGEAVKIAEATAGSTGGRSYTIAGCDASVMGPERRP
jgi:hypothetical protein